jgi:hypothetical protein
MVPVAVGKPLNACFCHCTTLPTVRLAFQKQFDTRALIGQSAMELAPEKNPGTLYCPDAILMWGFADRVIPDMCTGTDHLSRMAAQLLDLGRHRSHEPVFELILPVSK